MSKRRLLKLSERALNKKVWKIAEWVLFIGWIGFIILMTLVRKPLSYRVFRPELFYEIKKLIIGSKDGVYFIKLFIKNILLFIPFGFLFPWKKKMWIVVIISCVFSAFIECTQYVTMLGECELDDVIANTIGAATGIVLYLVLEKIKMR